MTAAKFDYYWRDYYGEVPEDALPGGTDRNGKPTYIGQLYVCKHGLLPVQIYKGEKSVTASRCGVHTSCEAIKILCSSQLEKFVWVPAEASSLHLEMIGKHLVVGGYENEKILNIGRGQYQEELKIGKVCGYNIGEAFLFFPYKNEEKSMKSFQVLVFENNAVEDIDVR